MQGKAIALLGRAMTVVKQLEEDYKAERVNRADVEKIMESLWVDSWALDEPELTRSMRHMWEHLNVEMHIFDRNKDGVPTLSMQVSNLFKQYHENEDWGEIMMNPGYTQYARWYFSFMYSQAVNGYHH